MFTFQKSIVGSAVAAALLATTAARADVIIDLFDNSPRQEVKVDDGQAVGTVDFNQGGAYPTSSVIGQYRDLSIEKTLGNGTDGAAVARAGLSGGVGKLSISNEEGVYSTTVVTWDGMNNAGAKGLNFNYQGLGGVDFTAGGATDFLAKILAADLGFGYRLKVFDMQGDYSFLSAGVQFQVVSPTTADYKYSWFNLATGSYCDGVAVGPPPVCGDPTTQLAFTISRGMIGMGGNGTVDFNNIGALQLELFSDISNPAFASADFSLGLIKATAVPEPGSLALVSLALLGFGVAGKVRRKA